MVDLNSQYMNALTSGGQASTQAFQAGSNMFNSGIEHIMKGASLALKIDALLQQEQAQKNQEVIQAGNALNNIFNTINTEKFRDKQLELQKQQQLDNEDYRQSILQNQQENLNIQKQQNEEKNILTNAKFLESQNSDSHIKGRLRNRIFNDNKQINNLRLQLNSIDKNDPEYQTKVEQLKQQINSVYNDYISAQQALGITNNTPTGSNNIKLGSINPYTPTIPGSKLSNTQNKQVQISLKNNILTGDTGNYIQNTLQMFGSYKQNVYTGKTEYTGFNVDKYADSVQQLVTASTGSEKSKIISNLFRIKKQLSLELASKNLDPQTKEILTSMLFGIHKALSNDTYTYKDTNGNMVNSGLSTLVIQQNPELSNFNFRIAFNPDSKNNILNLVSKDKSIWSSIFGNKNYDFVIRNSDKVLNNILDKANEGDPVAIAKLRAIKVISENKNKFKKDIDSTVINHYSVDGDSDPFAIVTNKKRYERRYGKEINIKDRPSYSGKSNAAISIDLIKRLYANTTKNPYKTYNRKDLIKDPKFISFFNNLIYNPKVLNEITGDNFNGNSGWIRNGMIEIPYKDRNGKQHLIKIDSTLIENAMLSGIIGTSDIWRKYK